jgi:hypothetical protein
MSLALAAAVLLAGVSSASAASTMSKASSGTAATAAKSSGMSSSAIARDSLSLTSTQRKTALNDITKAPSAQGAPQRAPKGFSAKVGAAFPKDLKSQAMPAKVASDVPALKPYNFAMLQKKVVIVNPSDQKIAGVITR